MPEITVKLFAALAKTSAENIGGEIRSYPLHDHDTINSIIERAELANKNIHLAILNGTYVDKTQRDTKLLQDGDVLALWPPIVGG